MLADLFDLTGITFAYRLLIKPAYHLVVDLFDLTGITFASRLLIKPE